MLTLLERIETGRWGPTTRPEAMNALADRLEAESPLNLGQAEFVRVPMPHPLRTWDVRDWGTYTPAP